MFYRSSPVAATNRRPGVVLLIVMAMLALFASLAISFVFYADSQAIEASYSVGAQTNFVPEIDADALAGYFLSQLIYDTNNPYSALRGWSLARSLYGYNPATLNFTSFNGIGRSALSYQVSFGTSPPTNVDNAILINYQQFSGTATAADPYLGVQRTPEWYGNSATPATYRYVGGANAPWTAYDTNSLFLAKVGADGTVYYPSFYRPTNKAPAAVQSMAGKYASLFPDPVWNPAFSVPDAAADPNGLQVKNLDYGPGMNDSNFIDLGYPIMTAPNGKRYKPLFAPLIVDLSNRLHLWAHGNRLGGTSAVPSHVSDSGFGQSEVNLSKMPGVVITSATQNATTGVVTMVTAAPHGLTVGASVIINAVPTAGYNGMFAVTNVPNSTTFKYANAANPGLPALTPATVAPGTALPVSELQAIMNLRYGGFAGTPASAAAAPTATVASVVQNGVVDPSLVTVTTSAAHGFLPGQRVAIGGVTVAAYNGVWTISSVPNLNTFQFVMQTVGNAAANGQTTALAMLVPNLRPGTFASAVDADALNTVTAQSSKPFFMASNVQTTGTIPAFAASPGGTARTVTVSQPTGVSGGFPWYFFDAVPTPFATVTVDGETVPVVSTNPANNTFKATFKQAHAGGGITIQFGSYSGFPVYPASWGNASSAELTQTGPSGTPNPLMLNLRQPVGPNLAPVPAYNMEALMRWQQTNSPALTSSIFQRMPATMSNIRARNMVTVASSHFDRVTGAPYLNFDRNNPSPTKPGYAFVSGYPYPTIGFNEVQLVTVTGAVGTYKLTIPGRGTTAAIAYNAPASGTAASLQKKLQNLLNTTGGGTVTVLPLGPPFVPPSYGYTVSFSGTLANIDVPLMTVGATTGNPAPMVQVQPVSNGTAITLPTAPNFGVPTSVVTTAGSEFGPDWRSTLGQRLRVDLSRPLRDYPAVNPSTGTFYSTAAGSPYDLAVKDRQQFALDLYNALVHVTGARDPNVNTGMSPTAADYQAARWLAQLAVNIVDYIDNDDYITPFQWYYNQNPAVTAPEGWVFGTELPRLVLNEAYAQQEPTGTVNVWAELYNPYNSSLPGASFPVDQGSAILQLANAASANPPYVIEIHATDSTLLNALYSTPANTTGAAPTTPLTTQRTWGTAATAGTTIKVPPANGSVSGLSAAKPITHVQHGTGAALTTVTVTAPAHGLVATDVGKPVTVAGTGGLYDGTFVLKAVTNANKFTYVDSAITAAVPVATTGTVVYGITQTPGFYVIGSAGAPYNGTARNPQLLASYLSPAAPAGSGMSFSNASVNIALATAAAPNGPGASHGAITAAGTTVTIHTTAALPARFVVGDFVQISGVVTNTGAATTYNTAPGSVPPQIASIAANRKSFTFNMPQAQAATLPTAGTSGSPPAPAAQATVSIAFAEGLTVLLRRLANPHLPLSNVPGPTYNPYITVDLSSDVPVNTVPPALGGVGMFRQQPYAGQAGSYGSPPTFFKQNVQNQTYDWLVHLDRPPVNPIELLHVSGYPPHQLTSFFTPYATVVSPAPFPMGGSTSYHTAPFGDPNSLIYRLLDQSGTHYTAGQYTGGRYIGLVNINTLLEKEVFRALCDAHDTTAAQYPTPWFTQTDVDAVFNQILQSRDGSTSAATPIFFANETGTTVTINTGTVAHGLVAGNQVTVSGANNLNYNGTFTITSVPTANSLTYTALPGLGAWTGGGQISGAGGSQGLPFKSFSAATTAGTSVSFNETFFRTTPSGAPVFLPPSLASATTPAHPYMRAALLQKIYNNITVTSNVFGVYCTVGFFEVVDETVRPARLGQEIGRAQNQHIRHRFFAVVDRSGMQLFNTTSAANATGAVTLSAAKGTPQTATMALTAPAWSAAQPYVPGNFVSYPPAAPVGCYYCIQPNTNVGPTGAANDPNWQPMIQPGMLLNIDTGANSEVVAVQSVAGMTFTASFAKNHAFGVSIRCFGNPGPKTIYNPHDDPGVVLHMSVIK